jgi:hypothetical protein
VAEEQTDRHASRVDKQEGQSRQARVQGEKKAEAPGERIHRIAMKADSEQSQEFKRLGMSESRQVEVLRDLRETSVTRAERQK